MRQVITGWALVVGLSVPAPRPLAVREVAVCSVRLELPRGAVVVGRVCLVDQGRLACAGDGIISVPERPPFGAKEASGPRGVLVGPVSIDVREERYAHETRYMVRQASQDPDTLAYVVTKEPLAMDLESRDCPREPRFLEAKENLALFAAGSGAVVLGRPLGSVDWPASGSPWLAVALERVR